MLIDADQFTAALRLASVMSPEELRLRAASGESRSYYVRGGERLLPLKAVARLAYREAGLEWDGPQSRALATALRDRAEIHHLTAKTEQRRLERQRETVERWARPKQAAFREELLLLYGDTCVVTGCRSRDALDAAHIRGVNGDGQDVPTNGIVLRADLHRLFDRDLMAVDPADARLRFARSCRPHYRAFDGVVLAFPPGGPSAGNFKPRWSRFKADA